MSTRLEAQRRAVARWVADPADTRPREDVLRDFASNWRTRTTCRCDNEKHPDAEVCPPCGPANMAHP